MTFLAPIGLLAGLLAIPVVALHVLRPHRDRRTVSSIYLWRSLEDPVAATQPWQRLRWSVPLVLQLVLIGLLAMALARPALASTSPLADHTVFILDTSASMSAADEHPDRLDAAKERIGQLLTELPDGAAASLVLAGPAAEIVLAETTDVSLFRRELDRVRPTAGGAAFGDAFTLAESLVSSTRQTGWVLVSDGGLTADQQRLAPPGIRYEPIGSGDVNRAVTSLAVTAVDGALNAVVTVANLGGPAASQPLRVDVDNVTVDTRTIDLAAGATVEVAVPIPPGSRVEAFLEGDDLLLADNVRAALAPFAQDLHVRIDSDQPGGSFFVREALTALGATVETDPTLPVDLVVYDGVAVPADVDVPFIAISPPTPPPGLTVTGVLERPVPTFLADDPLLEGIDIAGTAIARAQSLSGDVGTVLIGAAEGEPLVVAGRTGDVGWFHLAFRLEESNLPVSVAYPIMFTRMVTALTLTDDIPASVEAGSRLPSLAVDARVTAPRGERLEVPAGAAMPVLDTPGFWTVETTDATVQPVAVVFPAAESHLHVPRELTDLPPAAATDGPAAGSTTHRSLLGWVLILALVVLVLELLVSVRHRGVGRRQQLAGLLVGAVVLGALVAAALDLGISRRDGRVRAVVVLDVSDSLGAAGRADADAFLDELRAAAPDGSLAIVEVGRTAQVAAPFGSPDDRTLQPPAGDGTDLVRGVRLAAALLDGSSRERIVVVSDGLTTAPDLDVELERLARLGVRVEAHTLPNGFAGDIAVTALSAPSSVAENERFQLTATVQTAAAATVTVDLLRNDVPEASQTVDLLAGANEVTFDVTSGQPGLDRFELRIRDGADAIAANDVSYAAVGVLGPPKVLVIDDDGDSGPLVEALAARAVTAERRVLADFPAADELATFSAVVLVDVAARELSPAHLTALDGFVREQGNGLVVVGGTESFALGGYAETPLEDLLPVESRADDPTRDASVAEVLLIDASESMGACHCRDPEPGQPGNGPGGGVMAEGGVSKTDISRTAAERAVGALAGDDQVGVLAFNGTTEWIVPLQTVAEIGDLHAALAQLRPSGETRISPAIEAAAAGLRDTDRELRHIILFSDGFTPELVDDSFFGGQRPPGMDDTDLVAQAAALKEEGITVSVVATGEGAAPHLEELAIAGGGRFYPGRDLAEIPEIFVEEARIASRSFINEGSFPPLVTSTAAPVRGLSEAPPVAGYLATTPKETSDVLLQVGEFADPLLASWRVGLGKVTAWTSDGGAKWAAGWAAWSGWADFWSATVRDTFALEGASGHELRSSVAGEMVTMELVSDTAWPAGTRPIAHVSTPSGETIEVELSRASDTEFTGSMPADELGSYSIGVVAATDEPGAPPGRVASAVVSRAYPAEYRPPLNAGPGLAELTAVTGGRGEITAAQVLDPDGLDAGSSTWRPRRLLLLIAALLWPISIALRRMQFGPVLEELRRRRPRLRPA
jgi:Mg-chelatase subunit ChlD/uncharacterized membrane protein